MKERPILFNGEMIRAILDGRKTMTRRVVKNVCDIVQDWDKNDKSYGPFFEDEYGDSHKTIELCPYGLPGDRLWVRETFGISYYFPEGLTHKPKISLKKALTNDYKRYIKPERYGDLDYIKNQFLNWGIQMHFKANDTNVGNIKWVPSIHMPRWASRITLEITDVRVERVQEITPKDALSEGTTYEQHYEGLGNPCDETRILNSFIELWDSAAKPGYKWEDNPWVWVVEFKRVTA